MTPVKLEPAALWSQVKHSTTEPTALPIITLLNDSERSLNKMAAPSNKQINPPPPPNGLEIKAKHLPAFSLNCLFHISTQRNKHRHSENRI